MEAFAAVEPPQTATLVSDGAKNVRKAPPAKRTSAHSSSQKPDLLEIDDRHTQPVLLIWTNPVYMP
jgi:hypothetical protein